MTLLSDWKTDEIYISNPVFYLLEERLYYQRPCRGGIEFNLSVLYKLICYLNGFLNSMPVLSVNLPVSRWCNTRQTEDRFWVSIATWRRHQCVWQRSACTLCPASPSTTRTVVAKLAARPKPQVGTAISRPPYVGLLDRPVPMLPGQILSVISAITLEPALPAQASLSSLLPHGFYFPTMGRVNSINPRLTCGQGYVILFSYGCNVDLRVEQM